jgi:response regulator RpfG family c-di-GMP phosphodiesterase
MTEKVLLVDDDQNVLAGYKRQLRKAFALETADSGPAGLEALGADGPFAAVISDMRMPGMTGTEFLAQVKVRHPDCVRMMLTGNADLQTCIDAVNEGSIFRFLTKPCTPEQLTHALEAAIAQYRLVMTERELIHGTLRGALRTLSDILSLLNPTAFSKGSRIRRYVRHIAAELNAPYFWEYEMAATLSQIGCVALPPSALTKIQAGRPLNTMERAAVRNHPAVGCQLLAEIPRLSLVAQVIERQDTEDFARMLPEQVTTDEMKVRFGAQLLRVALDLDALLQDGLSFIEALSELHGRYGPDHPMVEALMSFEKDDEDRVMMEVEASQLSSGMVAAEDICTTGGQVVLHKGQRITDPVRFSLQSCSQGGLLHEPFRVEVLSGED